MVIKHSGQLSDFRSVVEQRLTVDHFLFCVQDSPDPNREQVVKLSVSEFFISCNTPYMDLLNFPCSLS